jgi:hypothetical protein
VKLLQVARRNKTAIAASVLTAGEAVANLGIPLPGSNLIPGYVRALAIFALTGAAFYFRWKAGKSSNG